MLDIVNASKTSHASKMLDVVGICVNNLNETLFFFKKKNKKTICILRRLYNEQVIHFFLNICMLNNNLMITGHQNTAFRHNQIN